MMETLLTRSWIEEFERVAREKHADQLERDKIDHQRRVEFEHRIEDRATEERREHEELAAWEAVLASPERVAAFRVQLDSYDTHTVEALMENREALDAVRQRIERMMNEAHVLPDGRRVFRTEDGQRVYDERGQIVSADVIEPSQIDRRRPTWEALQREEAARLRLEAEREQLLDYQRKLDEARERLDRGEITNGELNRLQADLAEKMPEAIRHKLDQTDRDPAHAPERDQAHDTPSNKIAQTASDSPAKPVSSASSPMSAADDAFLRQTGLGPAPAAPRI